MKEQTILVAIAVVAYCLGMAIALVTTYFGYELRRRYTERTDDSELSEKGNGTISGSGRRLPVRLILNGVEGRKGVTGKVTSAESETETECEKIISSVTQLLGWSMGALSGEVMQAIQEGRVSVNRPREGMVEIVVETPRKMVVPVVGVR